jgi:methylphosphotriester-DNA--protein-cysteine methyltransferase
LTVICLLESLELEPETSFERTIVCEEDSSIVLSEENLLRVSQMLTRLEQQAEANRKRAEELRSKIENIVAKLNRGAKEGEIMDAEIDRLMGHTPNELREVG